MSEKTVEAILKEKGAYIVTTSGGSMRPMLRHRRDTVTVVPLTGTVKKYDVVLFRRGEELVLHRVVDVLPEGYLIRGDHCRESDPVSKMQILGILSAFTRNGKPHTITSPGYVIYSRIIVWLNPVLRLAMKVRRGILRR